MQAELSLHWVYTSEGTLSHITAHVFLISPPIYVEDIYSFVVNTINIFIECNENISIFTSAKYE